MPSNQGGDNFVFIVGKDGKKLPVLTGPADQAVFAVTITGSNLPISPGDTLDIDYSVENTGGVQDTQDIRLDIDGSREDRDSDVTIAAGNTSTGTLSYSTSGSDDRLRAIVWSDGTQDSLDVSLNANYTVTIDSTTSSVSEGDDLDVTATIENTGSESGNQDITLETDSTVRDTFSSMVLGGSESKQITLTWSTSTGDAGSYTAEVLSQDDSDTESVSVGVPSKNTLHAWRFEAGSGTTATDNIGDADIALSGPDWNSSADDWVDEYALKFDGTDYARHNNDKVTDPGDTGTVLITLHATQLGHGADDGQNWFYNQTGGNRMYMRINGSNGNLGWGIADTITSVSTGLSADTTYRLAFKWDTGDLELWKNGSKSSSQTYSGTVNADNDVLLGAQNTSKEDPYFGYLDNIIVTDDALTQSQIEDDYNNQPWS